MVWCTETKHDEIAAKFKELTDRKDLCVVLITQTIAQEIRYLIKEYTQTIPTVLEIPSKNVPYDEAKDLVLQRVKKMLGRD